MSLFAAARTHELIPRILEANPHPELTQVLEGNYEIDAFERPACAIFGSPLFNVATVSMSLLRREPDTSLITAPLEEPRHTQRLERAVVNILNDSAYRQPDTHATPHFYSDSGEPNRHYCERAEGKFERSIALQFADIFLDDRGQLVFVQKEKGAETALSFTDTIVNGVRYPAGTIFGIRTNHEAQFETYPDSYFRFMHVSRIIGIAAIRLSTYALLSKEHATALAPLGEVPQLGSVITDPLPFTLEQLRAQLPSAIALSTIAKDLSGIRVGT